jgi:hypothetical protein
MAPNYPLKVRSLRCSNPYDSTTYPTSLPSHRAQSEDSHQTRTERRPRPLITPQPIGVPVADSVTSGGFDPWKLFLSYSDLLGPRSPPQLPWWPRRQAETASMAREDHTLLHHHLSLRNSGFHHRWTSERVLPAESTTGTPLDSSVLAPPPGFVAVGGFMFNSTQSSNADSKHSLRNSPDRTSPITFNDPPAYIPRVLAITFALRSTIPANSRRIVNLAPSTAQTVTTLGLRNTSLRAGYDWELVAQAHQLPRTRWDRYQYVTLHVRSQIPRPGDNIDAALRTVFSGTTNGKDGTLIFYSRKRSQGRSPLSHPTLPRW